MLKIFIRWASLFFIILLSGCSIQEGMTSQNTQVKTPVDQTHVAIEWVDIVKWSNKKYYYSEEETNSFNKESIGKELGNIQFTVVGSNEEENPEYQLKNGEATFAGKGSEIYSIKGTESEKMIVVQNKVYVIK